MLYPSTPTPSSVSAPAWSLPMLEMKSDGGYSVRRALASRPLQRYQLEYLGKHTQEMRYLRDFLLAHDLGVMPFQFVHPTAWNSVPCTNTTPVWLQYQHGLVTGNMVNISAGPPSLVGQWTVTRFDSINLILNGTVAAGATQVIVETYLPNAIARFSENTWDSPTKLIGPERLALGGLSTGYFNFLVIVEEVF